MAGVNYSGIDTRYVINFMVYRERETNYRKNSGQIKSKNFIGENL